MNPVVGLDVAKGESQIKCFTKFTNGDFTHICSVVLQEIKDIQQYL